MPTHDKGRDKRKISFPIYLYKAIVLPRLSFLHGGKSGHGGDELLWRREVRTEPQGWAVCVWLVCFPVSLNTLSLLPHEDYIPASQLLKSSYHRSKNKKAGRGQR